MPSERSTHRRAARRRRRLFDAAFLARLESLRLAGKRLAERGRLPGPRLGRRLGDGLEFADHRDYAPGDDPRYVDWPYFGRMERLLVRLFHEHVEAVVTILLDASGSMAVGEGVSKFDCACQAAAALAYVAMGGLERVRIVAFGDRPRECLLTGRDRRRILSVLDWLSRLAPAGGTDLLPAVDPGRQIPPGGPVLLISDLLDCQEALAPALASLRAARHDLAVLHVLHPDDAAPPHRGAVLLHDAEETAAIELTITDAVRRQYRRAWEAFLAGCLRTCRRQGATYLPVHTDQPLDRMLLDGMRRAGLLRG